jgi:hypothetical protein
LILWRGPSRINGKRVVVVATGLDGSSHNPKTGPMVQVYVLTDGNLDPVQAWQRGTDEAVCGDCPHRHPNAGGLGTCYVNVTQGPLQVWRSLHGGLYPRYSPALHSDLLRGRAVRFGAYGDPAAAPTQLWAHLARLSSSHTGYTHQWKRFPSLRPFCMASVDTLQEYLGARARGWRTFRVRRADEPLAPGEFSCPASAEEHKRLTCQECRACDGATHSPRAATPSIVYHGPAIANGYRLKRFAELQRRSDERRGVFPLLTL